LAVILERYRVSVSDPEAFDFIFQLDLSYFLDRAVELACFKELHVKVVGEGSFLLSELGDVDDFQQIFEDLGNEITPVALRFGKVERPLNHSSAGVSTGKDLKPEIITILAKVLFRHEI
jgi:hypothetical protein